MSEEAKKPATEAAAAAPAKPATPAGPALPLLAGVAAGALVAGLALGWFVVAPRVAPAVAAGAPAGKGHGKEARKEGAHGKGGENVPVFKLENVIVNPAGSQGTHFLMTTVAFQTQDAKLDLLMRSREVEIRDVVVAALGKKDMETLMQEGSRDSIKAEVTRDVRRLLDGADGFQVFLPAFVIQ